MPRAATALVGLALCGLLAGCASTYNRHVIAQPPGKLAVGASVRIATPGDGRYGDDTYAGSGAMTAAAFRAAFARFSNRVEVDGDCSALACLQQGDPRDYLVLPEILHWEDRATEWSGKPDRIEVKVTVYSGSDGRVLASTIFTGKSKWATFGGDHPQDLLPEPVDAFVRGLY